MVIFNNHTLHNNIILTHPCSHLFIAHCQRCSYITVAFIGFIDDSKGLQMLLSGILEVLLWLRDLSACVAMVLLLKHYSYRVIMTV